MLQSHTIQAVVSRPSRRDAVVFLDVDGVLHSLFGDDLFVESCCAAFESVIRRTGASIVLSSTWRLEQAKVAMLNGVLQQRGISPVMDCTKELNTPREMEICEWLDRHPEVAHWVAIDDMDLEIRNSVHAWSMRGHFVRTDCDIGLTAALAEQAMAMLQASPCNTWVPGGAAAPGTTCRGARPVAVARMSGGSFVPTPATAASSSRSIPPHAGSFVPPPVTAASSCSYIPPQAKANASYTPLPVKAVATPCRLGSHSFLPVSVPQGMSTAPPVAQVSSGSYVPYPQTSRASFAPSVSASVAPTGVGRSFVPPMAQVASAVALQTTASPSFVPPPAQASEPAAQTAVAVEVAAVAPSSVPSAVQDSSATAALASPSLVPRLQRELVAARQTPAAAQTAVAPSSATSSAPASSSVATHAGALHRFVSKASIPRNPSFAPSSSREPVAEWQAPAAAQPVVARSFVPPATRMSVTAAQIGVSATSFASFVPPPPHAVATAAGADGSSTGAAAYVPASAPVSLATPETTRVARVTAPYTSSFAAHCVAVPMQSSRGTWSSMPRHVRPAPSAMLQQPMPMPMPMPTARVAGAAASGFAHAPLQYPRAGTPCRVRPSFQATPTAALYRGLARIRGSEAPVVPQGVATEPWTSSGFPTLLQPHQPSAKHTHVGAPGFAPNPFAQQCMTSVARST
mmetsp:Transcript_152859/g.488396  ORF Transcript_152859/g.488396 Transcript_152859/m.488396 type:complete len:686 (-) Transcript_152859:198-2255(-)|eukprot:CAMPEP_0203968312 /NCGR_PEP_ID=MMETSP0359-20131031/96885_1 /ASSEMBLY_ACC=CAM_ASM_000338 /TAXON_ID=268821 /ORGANISM="Scrippsiella Hangoei, Strain SHTV-5" /LENGTH=685 /DNA_ID=CAMNT_0050906237 /DNA_START=69 /DNA_END=2126 /DNA_ORIENTATION=-